MSVSTVAPFLSTSPILHSTSEKSEDPEKSPAASIPQENTQNGPFGDETDGPVKYRTLHWWQCGMIMIAETISLGILSLPSVLAKLGMVGGVILILGLGICATYSGYVIGQFKLANPEVHSMADAFHILFRPLGPRWAKVAYEVGGACQLLFLVFAMASHILTWTICMNTLTNSATCTIVWGLVGLIIFWICDLPRTLLKMSLMSCVSCASVLTAVLVAMVALGVQNPSSSTFRLTAEPSITFQTAFLGVTNIVFAFAGHVAFFGFMSEMKEPKDFPKALCLLQVTDTSLYLIVAMVCYAYGGNDVVSPALGSAGGVVGKVAWGLAIPTIVIAGVIYGHVSAKQLYVRFFRGTKHMQQRTWLAVGSWTGITLALWVVAWIIAESIPLFNDLLALISSLFAAWFTYGIAGSFWLFLNWGQYTKSWKKLALTAANLGLVVIGASIAVLGLYVSGEAIHKHSGEGHSWTCASNAQY